MTITKSTPERIEIDLELIKPFKAKNKTVFVFTPEGQGTRVSWTLHGNRNVLMHVAGGLFVDKELGKYIERGPARLKATSEPR